MMRLLPALLGCLLSGAAVADVLEMPPQEPPAQAEKSPTIMELPAKGMTMHQVEAKFGAPQKKLPAVGKPPISRWIYNEYTVYFEGRYVIHSVLNQ